MLAAGPTCPLRPLYGADLPALTRLRVQAPRRLRAQQGHQSLRRFYKVYLREKYEIHLSLKFCVSGFRSDINIIIRYLS